MDLIETAEIVRSIMEQMNLPKPDKDPEDYIKNEKYLRRDTIAIETFMKLNGRVTERNEDHNAAPKIQQK
ncbi:hypothetical protein ACTXT7_000645 [Hymenolepis weldensis]